MTSPRMAAQTLLTDYFASRGESFPESEAQELLAKVKVIDKSRWFPRKYAKDAAGIMSRAAFNVEDLAKNFLGVDLKIVDLSRYDSLTGARVFGLADPKEWSIHICRRACDYKPLLRATVAHEAGHLQLHCDVAAFSPGSRRRPPAEFEADRFMQDLLAPANVLQMSVALSCHLLGLRFDEVVGGANCARGRYLWKTRVLPFLVNELCVSRQMLCLKFVEMGVLSRDTYQYHISYRMPCKWLSAEKQRPLRRLLEDEVDRLLQ